MIHRIGGGPDGHHWPTRSERLTFAAVTSPCLTAAFASYCLLGSACHLFVELFGALLHFLRADVFPVRRQTPWLAKRVYKPPIAIAPELILRRHYLFCTGSDGAREGLVDILDKEMNGCVGILQRLRTETASMLRKFITKK